MQADFELRLARMENRLALSENRLALTENRLGLAEKDIVLIQSRDVTSFGFKYVACCTNQGIRFCDSRSEAWSKSSDLYQYLVQAGAKAHNIGVKGLHQFIADYFRAIILTFLRDAETDSQRAIIKAYTVADVQRHISLVSPEELAEMSEPQEKICSSYLSLRFSYGFVHGKPERISKRYAKQIQSFSAIHPDLNLPVPSLQLLHDGLRRTIDHMSEAQQLSAVEQWASLSEKIRTKRDGRYLGSQPESTWSSSPSASRSQTGSGVNKHNAFRKIHSGEAMDASSRIQRPRTVSLARPQPTSIQPLFRSSFNRGFRWLARRI
ncbi:MAG: hypothetical protein Q9211_000591 [Gyalolechia sp. 1 TL-2023]